MFNKMISASYIEISNLSMKCVIPGLNVKVLARAILSLSRIGDELYVEPEPSKLSFRAVSASKSAYASFTFFETFFSYYSYEQPSSQDEDVTCKVSMKSCLTVFRSPTHLDKQVETCQIRLEPAGVKLIFEFQCRHGIIKTHYLPIIECETLEAVYSKDMVSNRLEVQPKILAFALMNFQASTLELTMVVTPQIMHLRNYAEDENELKKSVRTEFSLEPGEFDHYSIGVDTSVTFCLKEFRALLQFAEAVGLPITFNFETGGRPIVFVIKNVPTFEGNFVFATLMPLSSNRLNNSQCSSESSYPTSRTKKGTVIPNDTDQNPNVKSSSGTTKEVRNTHASVFQNADNPGPSGLQEHNSHEIIENDSEMLLSSEKESVVNDKRDQGARNSDNEEMIPGTPPPVKKARYIFQRCFQNTFHSQMLPGYDEVLAEDSDDESSEKT